MLVKEDFLKKLRTAFDLNIYEVKIWTALLSRGLATAGELSDIGEVPRSRAYDVLESLEKKGFVLMKLGKPIRYIAVQPEEIVKRVKERIKNRAETKIGYIENVKQDVIFNELQLLYKQGINKVDPYSLSGALKGRDNIYSHIKYMLEKAEKSVVIVTTQQGLLRKTKKFKNVLNRLHENGVDIKVAAPVPNGSTKELNEVKSSIKLRPLKKINARFVLIDDKEILFTVSDDMETHEGYDTGIWVNSPYFVKAFSTMFNSLWQELDEKKK